MKSKYVLGYDLNDKMSQISYFELNSDIPETIAADDGDERLGIPTVLAKRHGVSQWDYGQAARKAARLGESTLVGQLLSFASAGAKVELDGEGYDAAELLTLFVKRSLNLLSMIMTPDQVECMIFTLDSLEGKIVDVVEKIACSLPIPRERIVIQTYEESIYYYMLHQSQELWDFEVSVFDYSTSYLKAYGLWMNRHTEPVVSFVDKTEFVDIKEPDIFMEEEPSQEKKERLDELFLTTAHDYFAGRTVGTVFLLGEGFEGGWCDKTLKYMCMGKRVFQGRNLYSKGACYCGRDKLKPCELNKQYVFLGPDKLKFNLGIRMMVAGKDEYLAIADAGENWYDSGAEYEFQLGGENKVDLLITPLDGKSPEHIVIELDGLPDRPKRASRMKLRVEFESEVRLKICVEDMGFGEFYPATGMKWEKIIEMV